MPRAGTTPGSRDSPLRQASAPLLPRLPNNLGFDERSIRIDPARVTVLDGMGSEKERLVTVDELKNRFFILGLQTGFALQMFVMAVVMMATTYQMAGATEELSSVYYTLFRGLFLACFFFSCYGVDLYVWKRYRIDYRAILGVTHSHNYHSVMRGSFNVMTLVFSCFALYVLTLTMHLTPNKHVWPIAAVVGTLLALLCPWDWMPEWHDRAQRLKLLGTICRVLASPLSEVSFARTFVADVLTSMPKIFNDLLFTACMLATGNAFEVHWDVSAEALVDGDERCTDRSDTYHRARFVMQVLPFWVRLMQCCRAYHDSREGRHLANALKHCSSILVVVLSLTLATKGGAWAVGWAVASVASSVYAYLWDLVMDWGLRPWAIPGCWPHAARREFIYPGWAYYAAATTNGLARLTWAVYISPGQKVVQQHVILLLGCIELLRRAQWALLRLEWEQHHRHRKIADAAAKEREAAARAMQHEQLRARRSNDHIYG